MVFPAAFALGFSPWVLYRLAIDMPLRFEKTSMAGEQAFPQGPGPVAAARFLVHDSFVLGVWRGRDHILPAIVSYSWLLLVVVLVFVAAWMGLRSLRGLHRLRNRRAGWALVGPLLTLGLVVGMSARPATFRALPDEEPLLFYHLRYFTPLFVAAVLSMGAVIGSLFQGNRGRRGLAVVLLGLLVAPGVYLRCAELGPVSLQSLGILVQPSLRREDPPIRGRSPEQAARYLETHPDRFPEVRSHHFARAGRHLVRDHDAGLEELWSVALTDRDRRALCDGVVCQLAPGWRLPDPLPDQATLFLEAAPAAIRGELLVAAGRWGARGHGAGVPPGPAWYKGWSVLEGLRDEVLRGACEVAGYRTGAYLFHPGTSPERRDELRAGFVGLLAQCGESVLFDAGRAMTLHGGCSRESLAAALPAELDKPSLWEGVDWACAYERVF